MKTTIQIALVVAATAFALNAMSQTVGQPWSSDFEEFELPNLFSTDSQEGTWQHADDLRDKRINRSITLTAIIAAYPPSAVVALPLQVVDFFVTKRKLRKNASLISK